MVAMNLAWRTCAVVAGSVLAWGCVGPSGPVEVTRFRAAEFAAQAPLGAISVEAAPGGDAAGLEWQDYRAAVARELAALGYTPGAGPTGQVAQLRVAHSTLAREQRSPVSVGVGGSTGSWGSGLGLGIGINLSPRAGQQVQTTLSVTIRDRASNKPLWEGRATMTHAAKDKPAGTGSPAQRLASALFKDFPGRSGETIEVK